MSNVKTLVIYLPQYYETEYNSKWWGKGFTDWVAVKQATPCFEGHKQPKVPLNQNYYDLMEKNTLQQQVQMMKKYGVYGICFYHYYFKNGAKVLEKPAENLLKWKDIDIPFCFNWPSEKWIRTWSNFQGNVWGEKFDKDEKQQGTGLLLDQDFGTEVEWKAHFDYMLPFFKDERYIKIDGKPMFIFYNADTIPCLKKMIEYWRVLAKQNGFADMYFIGANIKGYRQELDASLLYEPAYSMWDLLEKQKVTVHNGVTCYDYVDVLKSVINVKSIVGLKTYFCGVTGYDTTPRRGNNGECFLNCNSDTFKMMMDKLYEKSVENGNEFVFINAWNEWGEGMYLEPDEINGYSYLESLKQVCDKYKNIEIKTINDSNEKIQKSSDVLQEIKSLSQKADKYKCLFDLSIKLATIIQNDKSAFYQYFNKKGIESVAVYGIGQLGKLLINQLLKENIKIEYTVDQYFPRIQENLPMYRPSEELPDVDIMIVTAYDLGDIVERLESKGLKNVVYIEDWLNDVIDI